MCEPFKYFVWGKLHGQDIYIKLHGSYNMQDVHRWMRDNKKYYNQMVVKSPGQSPDFS